MFVVRQDSQSNRKYELAPEGAHPATLEAVKDLGIVETSFGPKHRVRFIWRLDQPAESGGPLKCFQSFNVTFDAKSKLRANVRQIINRDPGGQFDLDSLVRRRNTLVIGHDSTSSGVYANIRAILPLMETEAVRS